MNFLIEPFQYEFIQRGAIAAILVGISCALLGVYVVLRRMSFIGHALTHSALPGLVVAYLLGINLLLGAAVATILTAVGIGIISKDDSIYEDTAIGIIPTAMFAFGILLVSATKSYRDLSGMLFGNILGVGSKDLLLIIILVFIVILVLVLFHKEFELFAVDPMYAKSIGININFMRYALLFLLSITVIIGIQAVGTILTNALLIAPVAAARLLTNRFNIMIILSCIISMLSSLIGVYLSYYWGLSSGASIVFVSTLFFLISWIISIIQKKSA